MLIIVSMFLSNRSIICHSRVFFVSQGKKYCAKDKKNAYSKIKSPAKMKNKESRKCCVSFGKFCTTCYERLK